MVIPLVHLFASQHHHSLLSQINQNISTIDYITFTVSYGAYCTYVVIYIPVSTLYEDTAYSAIQMPVWNLSLCEGSDFMVHFVTCMFRVVHICGTIYVC